MELSDGMDIVAYSMMNSQNRIMQGVNTQMLKNTLEMQEMQNTELLQMMELSVNPNLGSNIDIRV